MNTKLKKGDQCEAKTKSGRRCKNSPAQGTSFCSIHLARLQDPLLREQYDSLCPIAERFADSLQHQLETLIIANDLTLGVPIERRVKKWGSILEKFERKHFNLKKISDLNDLVGLRLIMLFNRDLEGIHSLLSDKFKILSHEDTANRLQETQFGYQSVHYVISFPNNWLSVPTMSEFKGLKAEIQVRTLAQHIWAAASHKLQYKREESVPPPLRRSIHRVSAILETVDLEFERLLDDRDSYVSKISPTQDEDKPLNVDILQRILALKWPEKNYEPDEPYSELLDDLKIFEIDTISRLNKLIDDNYRDVLAKEKRFVKKKTAELEKSGEVLGSTKERIQRGVFFTFTGLTRTALEIHNPTKWKECFIPDVRTVAKSLGKIPSSRIKQ